VRAGLPALLLLTTAGARAQVAPNFATRYLHPTDATDARALWVNPAGLGRFEEASVQLNLTIADPGAAGRLRQLTFGFNSRGLSFGYQRDVFAGRGRGHTYRVGFAGGHKRLAAGLATALYRGEASETGWEVGITYDLTTDLSLGGTVQNIGHPVVRGTGLPVTYVPSATVHLVASRAALSAHSRITSAEVLGYSFSGRVGLREGARRPLRFVVRLDTDRSLRRAGFAFGLSLGGRDVLGTVITTPGDAGRINALGLYGVSTRRFTR